MSDEASRGFLESLLRRPEQLEKLAPCQSACPAGGDPRGWIALIAQRKRLGLDLDTAARQAWERIVEVNPFPAVTGRICPHPCESGCNRTEKDGAVAINALERWLGDWALEQDLELPRLPGGPWPERVAVVGSGPSGLSFAYQLARRGYRVVVHERDDSAGGMLRRGVPEYRLPESVLQGEIERILALGVELQLTSRVGGDVGLDDLRADNDVVFLGIGAGLGRKLGIPGEDGEGCLTGTDYLRAVNEGRPPELGAAVIVVGGGNTAVDAARAARRQGCDVTLVYRRTRTEMPAIAAEVDDALEEGVALRELVAPVAIRREDGGVRGLLACEMRLGEPDGSGRRRPEPVAGTEHEIPADAVVTAVSQEPDWRGLSVDVGGAWVNADSHGGVDGGLWAGGDVRGLGIASLAIGQGRQAAEAVHARLRDEPPAEGVAPPSVGPGGVRLEAYEGRARTEPPRLPAEARLERADAEVTGRLSQDAFVEEAERCLSCGSCSGCQHCLTYCNARGFTRLEEVAPGAYFVLDLESCEGCGKCIEVCPCGFLSVR